MAESAAEMPAAAGGGAGERTWTGLLVASAAVELGILGNALLRETPWGINTTLWTAALVTCCLLLERRLAPERTAGAWLAVALGFAALLAWRGSPTLRALDIGAAAVAMGIAMMRWRGVSPSGAGVGAYARSLGVSAVEAAFGAGLLAVDDVRWSELGGGTRSRTLVALLRGAALALPLLLVFGSLLSAADASFARMLGRVLAVDGAAVAGHLFWAAVIAWIAAGVLRTLAFGAARREAGLVRPGWLSLGMVEAGTVLGTLNLLFLAFVLAQLPYFFGAAPASHAEYARRGFFELVAVAALALPLLCFADWIVRRRGRREVLVFRALSGATVALLFVIMTSALHRMRLYQDAFGLTELRLYTTAFMLWLGAVLAIFAATVLRGRRDRFAPAAVASAFAALFLLHPLDPDRAIVRTNLARAAEGAAFDARYVAYLGADGVPALAAALEAGRPGHCAAARVLLARWGAPGDWRSWSVGRARAVAAVRARRVELTAMACPWTRAELRSAYP